MTTNKITLSVLCFALLPCLTAWGQEPDFRQGATIIAAKEGAATFLGPDGKALPVADWAAEDSILLLWVTDPLLPKGLELLDAWGFTYKTVGFYWAKLNKAASPHAYSDTDFFTGMGFWTRANPEQCLLATRGHPKRIAKDVRRLVVAPRREHSRKPDEVYDNIERLADGPYLEMFARSSRQGWDSWGNQEELFDQGPVKTRRWASDLNKPGRRLHVVT